MILAECILAVGPLEREHHALAQLRGVDVRNDRATCAALPVQGDVRLLSARGGSRGNSILMSYVNFVGLDFAGLAVPQLHNAASVLGQPAPGT